MSLQIIYFIYMALNKQQWLIYCKTKQNRSTSFRLKHSSVIKYLVAVKCKTIEFY